VPAEIWASFLGVCILRRVEEHPGTSVQRISTAEGIGVPLVRRILHEQSYYPYHTQQVQALPSDHCAWMMFSKWLLAKCTVNTQFGANFLFTDEVGSTREGTVTFHNTHVWVDDSTHTTIASIHQHLFFTNV
jgi:hypothetical protein